MGGRCRGAARGHPADHGPHREVVRPPQTRRRESLMALWRLAVTGNQAGLRDIPWNSGTPTTWSGFRSLGRRRSGPLVQAPGAR